MTASRRMGRAEAALNRELSGRPDIGEAERAGLRICARQLDRCEAEATTAGIDALSNTYLRLRLAARLTASTHAQPTDDPFDRLVADITAARLRDRTDADPSD